MPSHIMVHHSWTKDTSTVSWGAVERYHREVQKWSDVGYHYGVEQVGDAFYALVGRPEQKSAAACYQGEMNRKAVHVCCIGNFDLAPPNPRMLDVLVGRVILPIMARHGIPSTNIIAHRDYATYKSCPGTMFDMDELRERVRKAIS